MRAAVVGTGFIGLVHVEALRRLGIEVTGIVGSSPERAAAKAGAHNLPEPYESFEAMLGDERVDVVHLATPNHLHYDEVRATLAAGKHVVCEKPLAMTSAQTVELLALAEASGLIHAVNFNQRFYPQNLNTREVVGQGDLGDVRLITGGYMQDWLLYDTDWSWRLEREQGGDLRVVGDIGSHWLDLVSYMTGLRVDAVMADLTTFMPIRKQPVGHVETFATEGGGETRDRAIETEDAVGLLVRFEGGARGVVTLSQVSAGRKNHLHWEINGTRASAAWRAERPEELWIGHRERANEASLRDPGKLQPFAASHTTMPAGHSEGYGETFRELYRAVYSAVAAGEPPAEPDYPTFAAGHEQALIGDAIARSHAEGRWVAVQR
ncbi:Gfo/Idh/MocA family oxidoreductase [Solirubrobacter ginsenosidimutans]|uniref:Gfo/Idh/MocA family oxidoreductase n=1 Tax=Solirubrobacter ginsenosidimutans TaxID=490573 RepID=A0A9X3N4R1_9ACTN|nr:Gfo/Idh/MocA family oxidoreductase [Solirubrobacter ginsenosidimutans]